MSAKIDAARSAVRVGSYCAACVIAAGSDLNSIRSVLSPSYQKQDPKEQPKGTLFATPGSDLEKLAVEELVVSVEVSPGHSKAFLYLFRSFSQSNRVVGALC